MTSLVNKLVDTYNYVFTDLADPRVNNYFLMPSPLPIVILSIAYLYFCTNFGPKYMKDRQPYNLKNVVMVYNVFQIFMSTFLFSEGVWYMSSDEFSFSCAPVDYSNNPRALRVANGCWWYFFSKITEYLDTIFFVLRKKNNQISFLHVYHHSMMAFCMWIGVKYFAGGHGVFMGTLNAFVHIIMYTYYFIAGLGPKYQKYIWWKKHVTVLQLAQFVVILIHSINPMCSDCPYPKTINVIMSINAMLFINMFGKFFYASYIKGKPSEKTVKNGTTANGTSRNGIVTNGKITNGTTNGHSLVENNTDAIKNGGANVVSNGKHKNE